MQLRQVNKNQNRFEIILGVTCEVTMSMHEVRVQFWDMYDFQMCFDL